MKHLQASNLSQPQKFPIAKDALLGMIVSMVSGIVASLLLIILVFTMANAANASEPGEDSRDIFAVKISDVQQGSLLFKTEVADNYHQAPILDTQVEFNISGLIARAKVTQSFTNPDDDWVEGVYVFPLPENAAVDHMRMRIGERIIEGEIKEKEEAKKIYTQAKKEGKKASLIEQERPNMFTNSVANIGPYETITVEIEYQQTLIYEQGQGEGRFQLRFPTTITPRYVPGNIITEYQTENIAAVDGTGWAYNTDQVPDASRITPPARLYGDWANPIAITVHLNAGFPINTISSPYHEIQTTHQVSGEILVELSQENEPANRDFNLIWTIDSGYAPKAALFNEMIDGEYYHLIMILPPTDSVGGTLHLAREVIYVIDTSGSMQGASMEQAKAGLNMALQRLRPSDTFNIVEFDDKFTTLFAEAKSANYRNINHAMRFVENLDANGGTEMLPALQWALNSKQDDSKVQQIIFLTDGSIGNESALFSLIEQKLGHRRLFTIGIGSAPNSFFMTRAAEFGRGTYTYIGSVDEVQHKMQALFTKLETPVLTNLKIDWPVDANLEVWPQRLPDLFLGEPLIVSAKTDSFAGDITVRGQRLNTQWQVNLPLAGGKDSAGVAALWARSKIKSLMDSMVQGADRQTVKSQIVNVALQHHLVSQFTSLVAVDKTPSRIAEEILKRRNIANNLPEGSHFGQLATGFAKTATDAQLRLLVGFVLLGLALIIFLHRRVNTMVMSCLP